MSRRDGTTTPVDHLRNLVGNVLSPQVAETSRGGHARTLVDHEHDLRRSVEVARAVVSGSQVLDAFRARGLGGSAALRSVAGERETLRLQLRDVDAPFSAPVIVVDPAATGLEESSPLIRQWSIPFRADDVNGTTPVVPGVVSGGPAAVNPTLPIDGGQQVLIDDVATGPWDYSQAYANIARQVVDWIGPAGAAMIDAALFDMVDAAAEVAAVGQLEAAALDDHPGDLQAAEGAAGAGGGGQARFVIVNPLDWPGVRAQVAASWQLTPAPIPIVTPAATMGLATFTGPDAFQLLAGEVAVFEADEPRVMGRGVGVSRPFKLAVRNPGAIHTVTLTV